MALENVKVDILREAQEKAQAILAAARTEGKEITAKADGEITQYKRNAEAHFQELVVLMERRVLAAARLDAQRLVLNAKKEALDAVFADVTKMLLSMGKAERTKFLMGLLKKAQQEIEVDAVIVSKDDVGLLDGKIKAQAGTISGGLIALSKDRTVSINYSLDQLLENARGSLIVELHEALFGHD